jgi:hypothetical protein
MKMAFITDPDGYEVELLEDMEKIMDELSA